MDIDDSDFLVVRKNLNIISVLIMILAFANAEIHDLNLLGIQVELEGAKLYVGLFIIYMYFIWRYLTKLPLMSGYWNGFIQYYLVSNNGVLSDHGFDKHREAFLRNSTELTKWHGKSSLVDVKANRLGNNSLLNVRLSATFHINKQDQYLGPSPTQFTAYLDITIPRSYFLRKLFIYSFKHDKFGDYLFPIIPIITNVLFFLLKPEWQGSYNRLF